MNFKKSIILVLATIILFNLLYKINFFWNLTSVSIINIPEPEIEENYIKCYQEADASIHVDAFNSIDNPDVQREYISSMRKEAQKKCRSDFPEEVVTLEVPRERKFFNIKARFW